MASDFAIVTSSDFIIRSIREFATYEFSVHLPQRTNALIDLSLLGVKRDGLISIPVSVELNDRSVTRTIIRRLGAELRSFMFDRVQVVIRPGGLTHGTNVLKLRPEWAYSNDYFFVGPIVCHYQQTTVVVAPPR